MKNTFIIIAIITVIGLPAFSAITPQEAMSDDYIYNHGHSREMAKLIDLQQSQINGGPSKYKLERPEPAYYSYTPVKYFREFLNYFDSGREDNTFMKRDIKYTGGYEDL